MKTDRTEWLDRAFRNVMGNMEMLSTVRAARLDGDRITGSKEDGGFAPVDDLVGYFTHRYRGCIHDDQRRAVIWDAIEEYGSLTVRKRRADSSTKEGRTEIGTDSRSVKAVAFAYGVSQDHVRRCRAEVERGGGSAGDGRRIDLSENDLLRRLAG